MQAYTGFAYVYDEYMDNIPYEEWCEYLVERLKEQGVTPDMEIADLGCGTGTVTQLLDKAVQVRLPSSSIDKFIIMENCECLVSENGNVSKIS